MSHIWLNIKGYEPRDFPVGTIVIAHDKHRLYPAIVIRHTEKNLFILENNGTWGCGRKDPDKCVPAHPSCFDDMSVLQSLIDWYNKENNTNIILKFI